ALPLSSARPAAWPKGGRGWFPRSLLTDPRMRCPTLPRQHRQRYAADLPTGLPTGPFIPATELTTTPPTRRRSRAALRPTSTRFEPLHRLRDFTHRLLAYTFPRRSPDPARLAVPGRPGFVRTAPTLPGIPRVRLPSASSTSCDWPTVESSHLHSVIQRLVAHEGIDADGGLWCVAFGADALVEG